MAKIILTILLTFAVLVMLLLTGCDMKKKYVRGAVDEEAEKQGQLFWTTKTFSKCGDSFYGTYTPNGRVFQLKDPFILTWHDMDDRVFTEADKLNGLEWVGKSFVHSKAYRVYRDGQWTEWFDYTPMVARSVLDTSVRKIKGKWEFGIKETDDRFVAIPCSQIPQE